MSTIFLFSTNLDNWTDWHFWLLVIIGGVVYAIARNKVGEKNEIREAEKRRRKTPSIQAGRFCSLFTMPYIEEAMPAPFAAYMQQTYPNILCEQQGDSQLHIVDKDDSGHDSERYLYFTHLKEDDILALRLHDPKEVQAQGRYQYTHITSPLDDKWPVAKAIRETIAHFQQLADEKKLTAKRK